MRDWQRTGVKLPGKSKANPNRAGEPGLGEGRTGERKVNLCKRRHRKIAETRSARRYWIIIGPGTPSCPGVNTEGPGVKRAPIPTVSPSCETWKPRWGLPTTRGSKATARKAEFPSGRRKDREANAGRRKARGNHNPPDKAIWSDPKGCRRDPGELPEGRREGC